MSNKNTAGSKFYRHKLKEDRLIEEMARRDRRKENAENVDHVYQNYSVNADGSKCWSF